MAPTPLLWLGTSRADVRAFPDIPRQVVGHELYQVQVGLDPTSWRPMPTVGPGVVELRVRVEGAFRVLYLTKFPEAVYVLHAFEKQTRRAARTDIALARRRLRALHRWRMGRR